MKTRTIILIAVCVLAVAMLVLFLMTSLNGAPGVGGSFFGALIGGVLLMLVLASPALDNAANADPRPRGMIYLVLGAVLVLVILASLLSAIF